MERASSLFFLLPPSLPGASSQEMWISSTAGRRGRLHVPYLLFMLRCPSPMLPGPGPTPLLLSRTPLYQVLPLRSSAILFALDLSTLSKLSGVVL